jgi:gliding motility-associated protein GldM
MINLMYVVLMAMLALNVSSDVLNGFSLVEESLKRSTNNASRENRTLYDDFDAQMKANPAKVREWFDKAQYVRRMSDSLYNFVDELKMAIVKKADGKNADINDVQNKEDLEAASYVMLAPGHGKGRALFDAINSYRDRILTMITEPTQRQTIASNFSTAVPKKNVLLGKNWQEYMFENMPVAAAVTLLTKMQNDVRNAEGNVLHTLAANVDVKDIRVNQLNAYVIPNAQTIVQGGKFSAQIIMAAVDTTKRPTIYVGGRQINSSKGLYETVCGRTGEFNLMGYIEMQNGSGQTIRRNFSQKYTVVAPSATVSADMMNVLYAGYPNPMSVSIPGVPVNQIVTSMSGGSLTPTGAGKYIAHPASIGHDVVITVSANMNGHLQEMGKFTFHVRKLPDPIAYINVKDGKGNASRFKGERPLQKMVLMNTDGIGAAIDDGLLDINFRVLGFETVFYDGMGNAVPEKSQGASFTARQKDIFRRLGRGKRFYITSVIAVGPDGIERKLPQTMQVIVN